MTATLPVQLGPLYYLAGAVAVAVVLVALIALRHRRPKSLEANVESFNRGLRALSPGAPTKKRRRRAPVEVVGPMSLAHSVSPSAAPGAAHRVVTSTVVTRRHESEADAG